MKTRLMLSVIAAFLCAATLGEAQIAPQGGIQGRPPQPKTSSLGRDRRRAAVTLAGCLYHEESIPDGHRMSPKGGRW